jgi:hypothetical protein
MCDFGVRSLSTSRDGHPPLRHTEESPKRSTARRRRVVSVMTHAMVRVKYSCGKWIAETRQSM